MTKKGFLLLSLTIYLAMYIFLCGLVWHFCSLYVQSLYDIQSRSRAFYVYHNIQNKFISDCSFCINVTIDQDKIIFYKKDCTIIWKLKKNSLVREEYNHKENEKTLVYLCPTIEVFKPFLHPCNASCSFVGFEGCFFSCSITIFAVAQKRALI